MDIAQVHYTLRQQCDDNLSSVMIEALFLDLVLSDLVLVVYVVNGTLAVCSVNISSDEFMYLQLI